MAEETNIFEVNQEPDSSNPSPIENVSSESQKSADNEVPNAANIILTKNVSSADHKQAENEATSVNVSPAGIVSSDDHKSVEVTDETVDGTFEQKQAETEDSSNISTEKITFLTAAKPEKEEEEFAAEAIDGTTEYRQVVSNAFLDTDSFQEIHGKVKLSKRSLTDLFNDDSSKIPLHLKTRLSEEGYEEYDQFGQETEQSSDTIITVDQQSISITSSRRKRRKRITQKKVVITGPRQKSIISHTVKYDFDTRFRVPFNDQRLSGDFKRLSSDLVELPTNLEISEYEEEEEEEEEEEQSDTSTARFLLTEKHQEITEELNISRLINSILQRKLADYFRKRKMRQVLKAEDVPVYTTLKYKHILDKFGQLVNADKSERDNITKQLYNLQSKRDRMSVKLVELFSDLQDREKEIGHGLIHTKTGNEIPDKYIEHQLNRQRSVMEEICNLRVIWIRLKTMVAEKEEAIQDIDRIDDEHTLDGYEKLKVENLTYIDKIEEKESELSKVRLRCQENIQIIAHIREKISALKSDIEDFTEESSQLSCQVELSRGQLNEAKSERDHYRHLTIKLKEESGLLTHTNLLKDMEYSMEEAKVMKKELNELQEGCKRKTKKIQCLRRKIEEEMGQATDKCFIRKPKKRKPAPMTSTQFRKPSIFKTTIPEKVLDFINKDFQPKVTRIRFDKI